MLRVTTRHDCAVTRLLVEGKLAGACVGELAKSWQRARSAEPQGSILVDLAGVTFVDASGKRLLTLMHDEGVGFLTAGLMTKCLIEEIKNGERGPADSGNNKGRSTN